MKTYPLVLIRHGESLWNKENRFTGWVDVDLSPKGREEATRAGQQLKASGFDFDCAHTSILKRAIRTLWIVLDELNMMWLPVEKSWRLNERHYGALQGLDKAETAAKYGEEQVHIWRRSYATPPPELTPSEYQQQMQEPRFRSINKNDLPRAEALKHTKERFLPYWLKTIAPQIQQDQRVLIVAHGNSLRALVQHLDHLSEAEIMEFNMPTGIPLVYQLDKNLKPISKQFLGDAEAVRKAQAAVASQGKKKL